MKRDSSCPNVTLYGKLELVRPEDLWGWGVDRSKEARRGFLHVDLDCILDMEVEANEEDGPTPEHAPSSGPLPPVISSAPSESGKDSPRRTSPPKSG